MNVGSFFDLLIYVSLGIYLLYIANKNKEKLANKRKWVIAGGVAMILMALVNLLSRVLK